MADREPLRPDDRPTGEMSDATRDKRTDHATHDLHVLAAAADRSVDEAARIAAEHQVAACRDCAAVFADLRMISAGLAELPRELAVSRDFRISPERAAQLRPAGWRGALQALFGSGPSLRPMANALTALGVAGLLLTVALPSLVGGFGFAGAGAAAPNAEQYGQYGAPTGGQGVGGGKTTDSGAPALNPGAAPGAVATASTIARDIAGSPLPYATARELYAYGSGGPRPASTAADSVAQPSTNPVTPGPSFPLTGVLAVASLGVLLLGLVLLMRSRARPFDSAG